MTERGPTSTGATSSLGSIDVGAPPDQPGSGGSDAPFEEPWGDDEGPFFAWLPREDRLWLHPSEAVRAGVDSATVPAGHGVRLPQIVGTTWAVAVVAGLIGALAATGVGVASGLWPHDTTVVRPAVESTSAVSVADLGAEPTDWTAVDDSVAPSVVGVSVEGAAGTAAGSGVVILTTGGQAYVVTDRSLLSPDMAAGYIGHLNVTFYSGQTDQARLVGQDPQSGLAVLATGDPAGLVAAEISSTSDLDVAAAVLAVGSRTVASVATGSVSGEDRSVEVSDGTQMDDLLALTMPADSPNADGGPILDEYGHVVGITVGLDPTNESDEQFTFAVPGDEVLRVATEMIDGNEVTHPWLGLTDASDVPSAMAHALGLVAGVEAGAVETGSPAGAAGMRSDDILIAFDGKPVDSTGTLVAYLNSCYPGANVPITYVHDGRSVTTDVKVGNEPNSG